MSTTPKSENFHTVWNKVHGKTHTDNFTYLKNSGIHSDFTFIVGKEKEYIKAHKLILMTVSPVFEKFFTEDNTIYSILNIPEIEPVIFHLFLQYVYVGKCSPEWQHVLPLLNMGKHYGLEDLSEICRNKLKASIVKETALTIFKQACQYQETNLEEVAMKEVCKYAYEIVDSEQFLTLDLDHLEKLLVRDDLSILAEIQLFEALIRWAEAECIRQGTIITPKYCRSVLETLIPLIRFTQMEPSEFSVYVAYRSILTTEELLSVSFYYNIPTSQRSAVPRGMFNTNRRKYFREYMLQRLVKEYNPDDRDYYTGSNTWHRVCFQADDEIWMTSISLNPIHKGHSTSASYSVEVRLEDAALKTLYGVKTDTVRVESNISTQYQVKFEKPIQIKKNLTYTASLRVMGKYYGTHFIRTKADPYHCEKSNGNSVKIQFTDSNAEDADVETNAFQGQMATLGFLIS